MNRTRFTAAWSQRHCSSRRMRANRGHWSARCTIIHTGRAGCRVMAGCFFTPSCRIRVRKTACTWEFLPVVFTAPKMVATPGRRGTMEYAWCSCPRSIRSSGSACIRLCCTSPARSGCFCKTIGGCIGRTTGAIRGRTSLAVCLRTLVSRC